MANMIINISNIITHVEIINTKLTPFILNNLIRTLDNNNMIINPVTLINNIDLIFLSTISILWQNHK